MRRFYFILITCIFSLSISAQRVINPNQRKEQTVIDKVQYRVTYRTKSVQNTENKDERGGYIYSSDDMRLDIGSKLSKFYSYSKETYEAKMLEYYQKGSFDTRPKDDLAAKTTIYDVMRAKGYEVKVVSVGNGDGTKEDVQRSFRQRTPRNPIELANSTKQ